MKRLNLIISAFFSLWCYVSCTVNESVTENSDEVTILGNVIRNESVLYDNGKVEHEDGGLDCWMSRSARANSYTLHEGSEIAFYASDGIVANGQILTLVGDCWKGESGFKWNHLYRSASVCAYHPPLDENSNLYDANGLLNDVLIAQNTYAVGNPILLRFEHLFTRICFHVETQLNCRLKEISFTPGYVVTGVNPMLGELSMEKNVNLESVTWRRTDEGNYDVLIPPGDEESVKIVIRTTDGRILQKSIDKMNCKRNESYSCTVKEKGPVIGIETADDFIAFTNLINGAKLSNHKLSDFGVTQNGITTYFLNKDIVFSEQQKKQIRQIGMKGFNNVFNGQGHTLSNVEFQKESKSILGLFPQIGEKGVVMNLHIKNSTIDLKEEGQCIGIFCGQNKGKISDCSIQHCQLELHEDEAAGIAGRNMGTIVNCKVDDFTISVTQKKNIDGDRIGGITSMNAEKGKVLNCLVTNIKREPSNNSKQSLSTIAPPNYGTVSNCVTDHFSDIFHPYCKNCFKACDHCYYPESVGYKPGNKIGMTASDQTKYAVAPYKCTPEGRQMTVDKLNGWIKGKGLQLYPDIEFLPWKLNETNSFTF